MSGLIFFIIMIAIIRKITAQNKASGGNTYSKKTAGRPASGQSVSERSASGQTYVQGSLTSALQQKESAASVERTPASGGKAKKDSAVNTAKAAGKSGAAAAEEVSTTEYLRQKALQDQIEHRKEARKEAEILNRETGGRMVGMRYMAGDSVPAGTRLVTCSYCCAENLISTRRNQKDYTCYFCREVL